MTTVIEDVKSLNKLTVRDAERRPVVDIQLDELLEVDVGHILLCFGVLAELDLIMHVFNLVILKKYTNNNN